ncbi:MAG: carboxy terminal-processing peptidase [Chthoniobacteraceae bacterium]
MIPAPSDALGFGEAKLDDPLPWDSVAPAPHAELDRVHPRLAALRAASALRVAGQPDFVTLREDIARMKHDIEHKTVSLNEAERRTEWDAAKKREEARKLAATVRHAAQPPSHEITLTPARPATDAAPADDASTDDIIQREALDIAADYASPAKPPVFSKN